LYCSPTASTSSGLEDCEAFGASVGFGASAGFGGACATTGTAGDGFVGAGSSFLTTLYLLNLENTLVIIRTMKSLSFTP